MIDCSKNGIVISIDWHQWVVIVGRIGVHVYCPRWSRKEDQLSFGELVIYFFPKRQEQGGWDEEV